MAGIGLDSRIGAKFLNPGVGWGGSCFGKDIQRAAAHRARVRLLRANCSQAVARSQRGAAADGDSEAAGEALHPEGPHHRAAGLAFKPDTDDLRDAPSLHIAERLLQMGARVKAYDPIAMQACREQRPDLKIRYCDSPGAGGQYVAQEPVHVECPRESGAKT